MYIESISRSRDSIEFKKAVREFYRNRLTLEHGCDIIKSKKPWVEGEQPREDDGKFGEKPDKAADKPALTNAAGHAITPVKRVALFGEPGSITQYATSSGGVNRNYYGYDGRQTKQISNHNHGNAKAHQLGKHGEHAHDYTFGSDGKLTRSEARELTDDERKENDDIL